jgi:hypothetical protein
MKRLVLVLSLAVTVPAVAAARAPSARSSAPRHVEAGVGRCTSDGACTFTDGAGRTGPAAGVVSDRGAVRRPAHHRPALLALAEPDARGAARRSDRAPLAR